MSLLDMKEYDSGDIATPGAGRVRLFVDESTGQYAMKDSTGTVTPVKGSQGDPGPTGPGVPNGGTAGQALTKIDGTDQNTEWSTLDASDVGAIPESTLSDKGDILSHTGSALAKLGLGSDNQVLTADSNETSGLKWATPASGFVDPLTTKGDIMVYGSDTTRLGVGTDGYVLAADSGEATGLKWVAGGGGGGAWGSITGTLSDQTDLNSALGSKQDTLPLTTKGDVLVYGSSLARLPVGTNGQALIADSSETAGVKWGTVTASAAWGSITGTLSDQTDLNSALSAKANLSGATFTGGVQINNTLGVTGIASFGGSSGIRIGGLELTEFENANDSQLTIKYMPRQYNILRLIPANPTATRNYFEVWKTSASANGGFIQFGFVDNEARFASGGTGTTYPLVFRVGGTELFRATTTGMGFFGATPIAKPAVDLAGISGGVTDTHVLNLATALRDLGLISYTSS